MELVTKEVRKLGGVFEVREIASLDDVDCDLLVNCSGTYILGPRNLGATSRAGCSHSLQFT